MLCLDSLRTAPLRLGPAWVRRRRNRYIGTFFKLHRSLSTKKYQHFIYVCGLNLAAYLLALFDHVRGPDTDAYSTAPATHVESGILRNNWEGYLGIGYEV